MNHMSDLVISRENEYLLDKITHVSGDLTIEETLRKDLGRIKSITGNLIMSDSNISLFNKTIRVRGKVVPSPEMKLAWSRGDDSWRRFPKI